MTSDEIAPVNRDALQLSDYDLELCSRLVLSPMSDLQVKRTARLLLAMDGRVGSRGQPAASSIPRAVPAGIRRLYETEGLQRVLVEGVSMALPTDAAAKGLALSPQERSFCQQIVGERLGSAGRQRRAQALLLLDEGMTKTDAAQTSGVCGRTLERLVERYHKQGAHKAVNDSSRSGRPVRYSREEFVPLIRRIMQQTQPETLRKWTMSDLRRSLIHQRREAEGISQPTLRALARQAGVDFRRLAAR